jgi:site-specific recombinase XerD
MESFAERGGYCFLSELIVDVLSMFRASWKDGALASSKKLERLRTFMRFALQCKWISDNPASALKAPSVQMRPTLPFTHNDMVSIHAAIEAYAPKPHTNGKANAQRMRSPVLLLR